MESASLDVVALADEIARDAAWRGARVVWGHSCELSAPVPYAPLVEVLHDADLGQVPEIWRQELGRLIPGLAPAPSVLSDPEQERGRMLEAPARALLALGQTAPHLVILEDVHWMDLASGDTGPEARPQPKRPGAWPRPEKPHALPVGCWQRVILRTFAQETRPKC